MNADDPDSTYLSLPPEPLPRGRFEGRLAFTELIRQALATAAHEGWRELILCDANFEDWPLGERAVVQSLQTWSKSGRRMTMLATNFDNIVRHQPRLVMWRKTWTHIIECRRCRDEDPLDFPSAIWSRSWVMQRLSRPLSAGVSGPEPDRRIYLRELLDARIRASKEGFPASVLGL